MSVATIEGIVENGQIRLPADVRLPEHAKVYVVIPDVVPARHVVQIRSPRLADKGQAVDFVMHVSDGAEHA